MPDIIKEVFLKFITVSLIASALVLIIQLISPLMKKQFSARWRYWAWLIFALWLLIPVTVPVSQAPIQISVPDTVIVQPVAEITPAATEHQTGNTATENTMQTENTAQENSSSVPESTTPAFLAAASAFLSRYTVLDLIIAVWAAGAVIVLFCRWVAALRFRSKLRRKWRSCDSPAVVRSIRGAMEGMGFFKEMDIKFCKYVKSPFMTGLFRPVLVLPEQDFDPYLLAHIVRHEITHYRRRDLWYKAVINLATAVHWFNPFVRVMSLASDRDLELVCDELVTQNHDLDNRKAYGESILLTVKPGLDRRPAALTTSFSRGAKNLKERFESIMLMKAKNSGIVFLALIIMLAVLASCGTGLNINKFDWTLYTNTEWRCEEGDADLYFKDKGKGIMFDLYISQICIVENVETAGKLKTSDQGYVDTFDGKYNGVSVKASIAFSSDGDKITVTINEAGGVAVNLGEYKFVKSSNSGGNNNNGNTGKLIMPDLTGMTLKEATQVLESNGLKVGSISYIPSSQPKDTICGQEYKAGGYVTKGDAVDLILSSGDDSKSGDDEKSDDDKKSNDDSPNKVTVPNVVGMSQLNAVMELQANNLYCQIVYVSGSEYIGMETGLIVAQSVDPGIKVDEHSSITLFAVAK